MKERYLFPKKNLQEQVTKKKQGERSYTGLLIVLLDMEKGLQSFFMRHKK